MVLVIFVFSLTSISRREEPLTYSQLQNLLKEGKADQIQKATLTNGENIGFFKVAGNDRERSVILPAEAKEDLIKQLNTAGVSVDIKEPDKSSFWFQLISSFFFCFCQQNCRSRDGKSVFAIDYSFHNRWACLVFAMSLVMTALFCW